MNRLHGWIGRIMIWDRPLTVGRLTVYISGCLFFALGADFFIASNLGTDPLDVFVLGLRKHVPMTIGAGQAGVAIICILIWALWNRKKPVLSPVFTFAFCGSIIDLLQVTRAAQKTHFDSVMLMLIAGVLCAYGSALIIMSGIGIRAMDLVAITMRERLSWSFWVGKVSIELLLLIFGKFFGGPAGVGTVYFLASVDLLIQPFAAVNAWCGMPNLGLPRKDLLINAKMRV